MTWARVSSGELDNDALGQLREMLCRSFDLESVAQDVDGIMVSVHDDLPQDDLRSALKQLLRARRYATGERLFVRDVASGPGADPQPALEAKGEVRALGPGLFAFSGDFLRVRTALDARVRAIAARRGADELAYPALWPIGLLQSINFFHDFPQLGLLASGVTPAYEARAVFAERFRKGSGTAAIACTAENGLEPAQNALAPTVCDCCYWLLRGRRNVASQICTVHGQVFRNEASADGRIDRLTSYTMREIVMIGQESFVLAQREALLDEVTTLVTALDLACSIETADDPFFCNDALQKNTYQNLAQLKYEVRVPLFDDRTTAVASINLHNDFFSRSYDFQDPAGAHPVTACVAFGYERLTYALFCRHGDSLAGWPGSVRHFLGLDQDDGRPGVTAPAY